MADYKGVLADLRARRSAIEKERVDLDAAIAAIERLASSTPNGAAGLRPQDSHVVSPRAFVGLTMPQALAKHFTLVNQPQTTRQIMDALKAGGMKSKGSLRGHVYNTLHRLSQDNGPFRHEPDSRWSLREWKNAESATADGQSLFTGGTAH